MREKLIQYVDLLFAGTDDDGEIKQEILQNTLDRYDDLVSQGKAPEAAYRLAISGIGDINEVIPVAVEPAPEQESEAKKLNRKLLTGLAIGLYILCPVPLFIIPSEIGLCLLLVVVAIATGILIVVGGDKAAEIRKENVKKQEHETELQKSVSQLVSAITLTLYFIISFATGAWYITWVIFPIAGAVKGLIRAVMDLQEANKNEN